MSGFVDAICGNDEPLENSSTEAQHHSPSSIIAAYLQRHSTDFQCLSEIRRKGWESKAGDEYFKRQRRQADMADKKTEKFFYNMMQHIGRDLEQSTGCFSIKAFRGTKHRILDMCAAPGGFLKVALNTNPNASALGFSLPVAKGGHRLLLPASRSVEMRWADITMFAGDLSSSQITADHPDCRNFLAKQLADDDFFDLVLCDGQVLRTHERAEYRQFREAQRLTATQLSLGLEHVRSRGTMVILLHKVEAWPTVYLLYKFHKFSSIRLFKSAKAHAKRSSFYLIATDIRTEHPDVRLMVDELKKLWEVSTFAKDDEYETLLRDKDTMIDEVLQQFGSTLIELGGEVWRIQSAALSRASFMQAI